MAVFFIYGNFHTAFDRHVMFWFPYGHITHSLFPFYLTKASTTFSPSSSLQLFSSWNVKFSAMHTMSERALYIHIFYYCSSFFVFFLGTNIELPCILAVIWKRHDMLSLSFLSNRFRTSRVCLYVRVGERKNIYLCGVDGLCTKSRERSAREQVFSLCTSLCVFIRQQSSLACSTEKKSFFWNLTL